MARINILAGLKADHGEKLTGMSDDQTIAVARDIRMMMVQDQLLLNNGAVGTDKESFDMMNANLAALERTALGSKRIKADTETADSAAELVREIAAAVLKTNKDPFLVTVGDERGNPNVTQQALEEIAGAATLIPGELDVGVKEITYDLFQQQVGNELSERRRQGDFNPKDYLT